jgi:hypothetical protein
MFSKRGTRLCILGQINMIPPAYPIFFEGMFLMGFEKIKL